MRRVAAQFANVLSFGEELGVDDDGMMASRRLAWIVEGKGGENSLSVFRVAEPSTEFRATRYAINPEYEHLLDRLPELGPLPPLSQLPD